MRIDHVASGTPVVAICSSGAHGQEHGGERLRSHRQNTHIVRCDGHYGRVGEMDQAKSDGTDMFSDEAAWSGAGS
jgi:hypothetical protein